MSAIQPQFDLNIVTLAIRTQMEIISAQIIMFIWGYRFSFKLKNIKYHLNRCKSEGGDAIPVYFAHTV